MVAFQIRTFLMKTDEEQGEERVSRALRSLRHQDLALPSGDETGGNAKF